MKILNEDKLLLEVELKPVQGQRFQPTGFPSLGPAEFTYVDEGKSVDALLVESSQSMANRMESVCWNKTESKLEGPLEGMPIVTVNDESGNFLTNSLLEAHRINSSYILEGNDDTVMKKIKKDLDIKDKESAIDMSKLAKFLLEYDPNSILHGLFLSKKELAGGRYKMTRALSAFIEAIGATSVTSGGVKIDRLDPKGGEEGAKSGFGHIPYSRTEYCAKSIKAYFNIDLGLIKSYGLDEPANDFLFTLAMWKIRKVLDGNLRLRTACDFKVDGEVTVDPKSFSLPDSNSLDNDIKDLIKKCATKKLFGDKSLVMSYKKSKSTKKPKADEED